MKRISIILTAAVVILFASCKKNLPDIGGTSAQKIANEWWVTLDQGGTKDFYGIGHFKMATYNTAANNDSIWVDDFGNGWGFKVKAKADYSNLTFAQPTPAANEYYGITVKITEGKVILGGGHSKSGNIVDSIHFKVEFSDDAGTVYEMNGHARTKFIE